MSNKSLFYERHNPFLTHSSNHVRHASSASFFLLFSFFFSFFFFDAFRKSCETCVLCFLFPAFLFLFSSYRDASLAWVRRFCLFLFFCCCFFLLFLFCILLTDVWRMSHATRRVGTTFLSVFVPCFSFFLLLFFSAFLFLYSSYRCLTYVSRNTSRG